MHIVPPLETPIRLSDYAVGIFISIPTKSGMKKAIKKKLLKVDGEIGISGRYILGGEKLELLEAEMSPSKKVLNLQLEVLFEDEYLAIIHKPAGILVSGNKFKTVANALAQNLKRSQLSDASAPLPVHRLDFPTSGLLLIGKTSSAVLTLNKMFENKQIYKTYHAVTIGEMNKQGDIVFPIDGKDSHSQFEVLQSLESPKYKYLNLVKLIPSTGRRHQLRIHLSKIGNPILGDKEYGQENLILLGKGLYLHASSLQFQHPFTKKEISIEKELPRKFIRIFSS
ncbi:MAG: RluA family pseudouridine synthase [Bacteroidales bacterium]|nr:RluA family pseudouridine synthase [Bacteroidales bacterium]